MNKTNKTQGIEMKVPEMSELLNGLEPLLMGADEDFKIDLLLKLNDFPVYFGFVSDLFSRKRVFSPGVKAEEAKRVGDYNISQANSLYGDVNESRQYKEKFEWGMALAQQSEI